MDESLDPLDRATMATWKASNVVTWGAVALGSALLIHTVGDELAQRFHRFNLFSLNRRPESDFGTWQFLAPSYGYKAFIAIVVGAVIGFVVGSKVLRAQTGISGFVAAAYAVITWVALETSLLFIRPSGQGVDPSVTIGEPRNGFPSGAREWSYSLLALIAVAVAPVVARFVVKRRERLNPGIPG